MYLTDRVIPMLPHTLSNGFCSLNQGEDRLALSCIMEINDKGVVIGHEIAETLIRVDRRMTYTAVNAIITDDDAETKEKYKEFVDFQLSLILPLVVWLFKRQKDFYYQEKTKEITLKDKEIGREHV